MQRVIPQLGPSAATRCYQSVGRRMSSGASYLSAGALMARVVMGTNGWGLGGFRSERDVMTVTRIVVVAALGAYAVGAGSQSPSAAILPNSRPPSAAALQKQYVGQQWVVNYSMVPCSHQVAEITALEVFKDKGQAVKPAKGESVAIEPPGQKVRFTLRCPDGNSYTREIAVRDFQGEFAKPPSR